MRRMMLLGGWYATLFAAILLADPPKEPQKANSRTVSTQSAPIRSGPSDYTEQVGTAKAGQVLEVSGVKEEGFVQLKDGKGWISETDLFTLKQEETLKDSSASSGGAGSEAEGAYVKGFDPEVEGKMREDNPGIDRIFKEEVLPWVWRVRAGEASGVKASEELETLEEQQEKLLIQAQPEEAAKLQPKIDEARQRVQSSREAWQTRLRAWRQAGQLGDPTGRK